MKRIFKRCPSVKYESDYEVSIQLLDAIANETREPYNTEHPAMGVNEVLNKLLNGEEVRNTNPFGTEVIWTMEDVPA